jgi:hypothetical protein
MWANLRCFWVNFVRIANFVAGSSPYCAQKVVNRSILPHFSALNAKTELILSHLFEFLTGWDKILSFLCWNQKFIPTFDEKSGKVWFFEKMTYWRGLKIYYF